ncbi:hypothetical protein [Patulibacter defluvii]|uniref:hypothetical protein n=1 Tax=Patulibacter defluvii TaxID=3095358 RepID=UPI002A764996|nr:hypothetical protein [Patulibacter sp. DM4]
MPPGLAQRAAARRRAPLAIALATGACAALLTPAPASIAAPAPVAAGGKMTETVALKLVRKSGSDMVHSGTARGNVNGSVRSNLRISSLKLTGTATVRNRRGTIKFRFNGRARSSDVRTKFDGSVRVTGGTGAYRRASGSGRFDGIVNRRTWAASLRVVGSLRY